MRRNSLIFKKRACRISFTIDNSVFFTANVYTRRIKHKLLEYLVMCVSARYLDGSASQISLSIHQFTPRLPYCIYTKELWLGKWVANWSWKYISGVGYISFSYVCLDAILQLLQNLQNSSKTNIGKGGESYKIAAKQRKRRLVPDKKCISNSIS